MSTELTDVPRRAINVALVVEAAGGGTGRHVIDLARGLAARGYRVTVFFSPLRAETAFVEALFQLVDVRRVPVPIYRKVGRHDLVALRFLTRLLVQHGPFDIVHGHSSKAGALVRLLPRRVAGARLYSPHAIRTMDPTLPLLHRGIFALMEGLLALRHGVIVAGSVPEVEALRALKIQPRRIELLQFGIDPIASLDPVQARRELSLPDKACVLGFLGRLSWQKAPERAISALAHLPHDIRLAIVGEGPPDVETRLHDCARHHGVAERVHFLGYRHGQRALAAFDILIVPSRYDSSPYVLLEAIMADVPIVAASVGMAAEIVGAGGAGRLVPNTDEPAIWATAVKALCNPPGRKAAKRALQRLRTTRSLDAMITQMESIYERAVTENSEMWPQPARAASPEAGAKA